LSKAVNALDICTFEVIVCMLEVAAEHLALCGWWVYDQFGLKTLQTQDTLALV